MSDDIEAGAFQLLSILRPSWGKEDVKFTVKTKTMRYFTAAVRTRQGDNA